MRRRPPGPPGASGQSGSPGPTYPHVGASLSWEALPAGYTTLRERRRVGGPEVFEAAARIVLGFGMQRGSGIDVRATAPQAAPGVDVLLRVGLGPLRLTAPTRVVAVVEEPDRRGFAYGTLPGHPEQGEELFLVERDESGTWAEVRAFSRPARLLLRLGGPLGPPVQRWFARRYLSALEAAVRHEP